MVRIVIVGAGGHGRVISDILSNLPDFDTVGFIDDDPAVCGTKINGRPVLGKSSDAASLKERFDISAAVIAIGDNKIRSTIFERFLKAGFSMPCIVHPKAIVSSGAMLGKGVVVMPGAIINIGSVIGDDVCINTAATVDHDCKISDHSHIFPGANITGGVCVGRFSYIGTNAAVNPNISIGENVMIGTGAAVVSDIPDGVVAVGVPAKIIKKKE
jgi:sugar O-acyltransferase (sialic acid O-acetyltransferase NeuD family)